MRKPRLSSPKGARKVPRAKRAPKAGYSRQDSRKGYGTKEEWKEITARVKTRDRYTCQGRGCVCTDRFKLQVHHIIPLSKGGTNSMLNLLTLCVNCHAKRHDHMH